ncbi:MAG: tol-pal system protein YbgF [Gammaproteobacteria bacterium]|nr:tol-pal system protein YbgF [Gammaproteobacteria bacterium]
MQVVLKLSLLLSSLLVIGQAIAEPPEPLQEVVQQYAPAPSLGGDSEQSSNLLDKKLDGNVIYDLLEQIAQLKREVSELRGISEQQSHEMALLTKRQRSLYQDVDRRMLELEAGSSARGGQRVNRRPVTSSGLTVTSANNVNAAGSAVGVPAGVTDAATEQAAYTKAFNLLKEGDYSQSITAFRSFLATYSTGKYADNAQYWLGEANYATRDYKTALAEFNKILADYPDSPKRKDAELKIGFTYYELKNWDAAKKALNSVLSQYPGTTNARTAQQRLERMAREGR